MRLSPSRRRFRAASSLRGLAACVLALLAAGAPRAAGAQGDPGAIAGTALRLEDGAPIPFALIRLLPAEPPPSGPEAAGASAPRAVQAVQQVASNSNGRFHFAGVAPGAYRLQLARIGHHPVLSPVLRVRAGETLRQDVRGTTQAVRLDPVVVRGTPTCLTGARLGEEPRLATLWAEVQKGAELRRAFDRQYRYTTVQRQDIAVYPRLGTVKQEVRVDSLVREPDSVLVRARRRQARRAARGYAAGNLIALPDDAELLDAAFLRGHCLETAVAEAGGALGLRFRPVRRRREGADVRGTIWVSADGYQMRRLEFEYLDAGDKQPFARSRTEFADVAVGGSALRLRTAGDGVLVRLRGRMRATTKRVTTALTYTYRDVRQVGGP